MVKRSIKQALESGQPSLNFLNLPNPEGVDVPDFVRMLSLNRVAAQMPVGVENPQYSTKWQLLATAPALSHPHIDAGKFATWVQVRRGAKIWAVLDGPMPGKPLTEFDLEAHKWIPFLLEQDDILIMPPGTVHCVLTVQDSFAVGGHFYTKWSLGASFEAGDREHRTGLQDTNTQHVRSELILHATLRSYAQAMHDACARSERRKRPMFRKCVGPHG
ncbi:hypothetical protein JB92DRAFT_129579 [Gautieria morchelliformis]|nr:hypothetical protein JB92DRAFT_129579 [Gautieria morchelliformis]